MDKKYLLQIKQYIQNNIIKKEEDYSLNESLAQIKENLLKLTIMKKKILPYFLASCVFSTTTCHASFVIDDDCCIEIQEDLTDDQSLNDIENASLVNMDWNILQLSEDEISINQQNDEEMSYVIRKREILTKEHLENLLYSMCGNNPFEITFSDEKEALEYLYLNENLNYFEKILVIMARENLTFEQLDTICAGVVAEGGNYYEETYRVASVIFNRAHSKRWSSKYGVDIYNQFIAPYQFETYSSEAYKKYLGCFDLEGYQGAIDMFYSRVVSIDYLSFRASNMEVLWEEYTQYMPNGNKFGVPMNSNESVESDYIYIIEEELEKEFEEENKIFTLVP